MTKQSQKSGDKSTNIQAEEINIQQGLTYSEAKEVAIDVFNSNFQKLSGIAEETAKQRADKITEDFLNKIKEENGDLIEVAKDPDFQHSIFTVQKEFARSGDEDLGGLLVDLLVDRSKNKNRNILQIVLNESLEIAPKLTNAQLSALSLIFFFRYTASIGIGNHETLGDNLDNFVKPFAGNLVKGQSTYQHLEYAGCGSISISSNSLSKLLKSNYKGLFLNGIDESHITNRNIPLDSELIIECINDSSKFQVAALNDEVLGDKLKKFDLSEEQRESMRKLFNINVMSDEDLRNKCVEIRPYMGNVFDVWSNSYMKNMSLTSVGIAIGHANIKRFSGEFTDLSIWINSD